MPLKVTTLGRVDYGITYEAMQSFTTARSHTNSSQISLPSGPNERDQLWICEHSPVFTQGLAGKADHVICPGDIPVVQTDRGGQVTYHGPGQVVAYPLIDLKRAGYYVKEYVYRVEEAVIRTLMHFGVTGHRVPGAPGIYVRLGDPYSHARLDAPSPQPSPGGSGSHADAIPLSPPVAKAAVVARSRNSAGSLPLPLDARAGDGSALPNPFLGLGKIAALGIKVSRHCTYHGVALNVAMDLEPYSRINPCGYAGLQTVDLSTIGVSAAWQAVADVLGRELVSRLAPKP